MVCAERTMGDTMKFVKGIWLSYASLPVTTAILDDWVNSETFYIFLRIGEWTQNHTINYYVSDSQISTFVASLHARNVNFKAIAWVHHNLAGNKVDLTTSAYQQQMFDAIVSAMNKGFDGFNDDLEPWVYNSVMQNIIGTWQNYIDYLNGMSSTVRSLGKISTADLWAGWAMPVETVYSVVNLDYVIPMLYNGGVFSEPDFKGCLNRILVNSLSPVLVGIAIVYASPTLDTQLTWIDAQLLLASYPKFAGAVLFRNEYMTGTYWILWRSWAPSVQSTLPFRDDFTIDLSKWSVQKGQWIIQ